MKKENTVKRLLRRVMGTMGTANTTSLFGPKSWAPQTDYSPVRPDKRKVPELDNSPEAAEARAAAAKHSLLVPLAAIAGVIAVLVIAVLIKANS